MKFAKFLCGLSMLALIWGLVWGIFFRDFLWMALAGMVVGAVTVPFTEEEE